MPGDDLNDIFFSSQENDALHTEDILKILETLPKTASRAIYLYAIEGYSHAEIAEMLGITEATSRSQFMRARKILQKNVLSLHGKEYAEQYK